MDIEYEYDEDDYDGVMADLEDLLRVIKDFKEQKITEKQYHWYLENNYPDMFPS